VEKVEKVERDLGDISALELAVTELRSIVLTSEQETLQAEVY
jgi:hypothetical protein